MTPLSREKDGLTGVADGDPENRLFTIEAASDTIFANCALNLSHEKDGITFEYLPTSQAFTYSKYIIVFCLRMSSSLSPIRSLVVNESPRDSSKRAKAVHHLSKQASYCRSRYCDISEASVAGTVRIISR